MTLPKRFCVQFCASNSTHVKMWKTVISVLRQKKNQVKIEILSLDSYYAQTPFSLIENIDADDFHVLARNWSNLSYWVSTGFKKMILIAEAMFRVNLMLRKLRPDLVVLGNDIGVIEVAIIKIASLLRIPTLLVQDGILNGNLRRENSMLVSRREKVKKILFKMLGFRRNHVYGHGDATAMAVMGQYTYDLLQGEGKNMDEVFITGQPRFDAYENIIENGFDNTNYTGIRRRYEISDAAFVIGLFTQPLISYGLMKPEQWDYIIETILLSVREVMENNDCCLVIKLHPAEHLTDFIARYSQYIIPFGDRVILDEKAEVQEVIQMADLVVVYSSTVSLEAILFDKPVIMFDPYDFLDDYRFVNMGAAIHTATKDDLVRNILLFKENPKITSGMAAARSRVAYYHSGSFDGLASSRVADLITKYLMK